MFVTHDIDEAVKLGDQVAVLRVGGKLAQLADPAHLLAHPADDFVADFVGRDRGYRGLGFRSVPDLPLRPEPTVRLGATKDEAMAAGALDDWLLVTDENRRPLGWVEPSRIRGAVESEGLQRGGTLAPVNGTLRSALDAALSSPSRRGVIVDETGAFAGTVLGHQVLSAIESSARPPASDIQLAGGSAT